MKRKPRNNLLLGAPLETQKKTHTTREERQPAKYFPTAQDSTEDSVSKSSPSELAGWRGLLELSILFTAAERKKGRSRLHTQVALKPSCVPGPPGLTERSVWVIMD